MNYAGEPFPRPQPDTAEPELTRVYEVERGGVTGSPGPMDQPIPSLPYNRAPFGELIVVPPQDAGIGMQIKQAGAGRAPIPARIMFPEQAITPQPDGRRIARPMPIEARDHDAVIRP